MSREIDQKVVEMQFDNKNFEKNVQTSISTIDRLKSSLDFSKSTKSLETLEKASSSFDMAPMEKAVDAVKSKFSAFEVMAITVLANITNSAVNAGKQLVKSLSVDQIKEGWSKYEEMTASTQTIIAATGKDIDYVSERLDKLNWFTDETSYNLTDMTNNIGKFTSAGVDLDKSVSAMEGIATAAALSGQNSQAASRAMYNFSQALGMGSVKLQDWMSIENANMATKEFKETIIETAKDLGRLDKKGNIIKKTADKYGGPEKVDFKNFRETVSAGWFDSDVLIASLKKYGDFADKLKTAVDKTNLEVTSDMLRYIDQYKAGTIDMETASKNAGVSAEELGKMLKELSSDEYELGRRAFKAAQEAKTFTEVIDATKDAVSTKWMKTFELIFGNYEEAKVFWTNLANAMYDVFAASGDVRNAILADWKELGGRDDLLESFWNLWEAIESVITPIKEAFRDIFPPMTAKNLFKITKNLKEFTSSLKLNKETSEKVKTIFKGLFSIFDILKQAISALLRPLSQTQSTFRSFGGGILGVISSISSYIIKFDEFLKKNEVFIRVSDFLIIRFRQFQSWLHKIKDSLSKVDLKPAKEVLESISSKIKDVNVNIDKTSSFLDKLKSGFEKVLKIISPLFYRLADGFSKVTSKVSSFFKNFNLDKLTNLFSKGLLTGLLVEFIKFLKSLKESTESLGSFKNSIIGVLDSVKGVLESWQKDLKAKTLLKIAGAIGILAASLLILSMINPENLGSSLVAITVLFTELGVSFSLLSKNLGDTNGKTMKKIATSMVEMSGAILILSIALKVISSIKPEKLAGSVMALSTLLYMLMGAIVVISKNANDAPKAAGILFSLSTSLIIISTAVKILGSMDLKTLGKGIGSVVILLGALMGALIGITRLGGDSAKGAIILLSLSASLLIISKVIKTLGKMNMKELGKGAGAVVVLLASLMGTLIGITRLGKQGAGAAVILLSLSASLLIISKVVEKLSSMNIKSLAKGIGSVIILLAALTATIAIISKRSVGAIAASASILIFALALIEIAGVIKLLGSMDIKTLAIGLGSIVFVLGVFVGAALLTAPIIPIMLALAGALTLFGVACLGVGVGVLALSAGLTALSVSGVAGIGALITILKMLIDMIPMIFTQIGLGILNMIQVFTDNIPTFVGFGLEMIKGIMQGVNDNIYEIVSLGIDIITNFINGIANGLPDIIDAGWNLAIQFVNGVADGIDNHAEEFNTAIHRLAASAWNAFLDFFGIHSPSKKAENGAWQIVAGIVQGIGSKISDVVNKVKELGRKALNGLHEKVKEFKDKGKQAVTGFINGIGEKIEDVVAKGKELGGKLLSSIKNKLKIESPSKEAAALGEMVPLGLVKGASKFGNKLRQVGENIGSDVIDSLSDSMSNIIDIFDYTDGFEPVITPVLDDSNVRYGFGKIESMFNNGNVVSLRAVTSLSNSMENNKSNNSSSSQKGSIINNFTQNNYSPKSLSNAEIYRNTKTLFAKEKGDVKTA